MVAGAIQSRECTFCFKRQTSEKGLFYSADDVTCVCFDHIGLYEERTKAPSCRYLNYKKVPSAQKDTVQCNALPTKMEINTQGGFNVDQEEKFDLVRKIYDSAKDSLVDFDPFSNHGLEEVSKLLHQSPDYFSVNVSRKLSSWHGEKKKVYKEAENLFQVDNPPQINLNNLKCCKCDLTKNLWLNLSDGKVLCGRKYFDGSGGNNHAVEHYDQTGYPLAVKLGTITKLDADVYCYPQDENVTDLYLSKHLKHFGIDIDQLKKTDKSQVELEIELNKRSFKRAKNAEDYVSRSLDYAGLTNIGNTCYLASVLQCLARVDSIHKRFVEGSRDIFLHSASNDINQDFNCQMSKVMVTLSSTTSNKDLPKHVDGWYMIEPHLLKFIIGQLHAEFSTHHQQDASELLMHLSADIDHLNESKLDDPLSDIRYHTLNTVIRNNEVSSRCIADSYIISFHMDSENSANVSIKHLLDQFTLPEKVDDNIYTKNMLCYLPNVLCVCIRRFRMTATGNFRKSNAKIQFPDGDVNASIDFQTLIAQHDDVLNSMGQVESDNLPAQAKVEVQDKSMLTESQVEILSQLQMMGFDNEDLCVSFIKKGLDLDTCIASIIEAQENGNTVPNTPKSDLKPLDFANVQVSDEYIEMLVSMGYSKIRAIDALKFSDNSLEAAANMLMNDAEGGMMHCELTGSYADKNNNKSLQHKNELTQENFELMRSRSPIYRLKSFIVHHGKNTNHGHYIAYIRLPEQPGSDKHKWFEFNDEKVHEISNPPYELAYLYFFERVPLSHVE